MALNIQDLLGKFTSMFSKKPAAMAGTTAGLGQIIGPILGLIVLAAGSYFAVSYLRVGGPVYQHVKELDDLRADMLPPPLFVVEPYAIANEIYQASAAGDNARITRLEKQFARVEKEYSTSIARWSNAEISSDMLGSYKAVEVSGKNFYNIYKTKFVPAYKSGSSEVTQGALHELEQAYKVNNELIQSFVLGLQKESVKVTEDATKNLLYVLIALGFLTAFIAGAIYVFGKRQINATNDALEVLEKSGQENQLAVLDLLDEMGDLSEGDLTVRAVVKENIAGAIADSINYTIDSLRDVVTEINRASEQVNTATTAAQGTSVALLEAAEMQSQQIAETTQAVNGMSSSIQQVATNASQAAQVAQRSLQAATQGSQAVQNTIAGMNGIREQIQETSKRIKRLGESSQEIGEIVELISDITEQTNILALNAAIQAASAGEAGRGFTVVAEEVQRLAERSSEATKQISAIVKTIQTDTNSAVAAMEKSTEGVVEGAKLSDAAGQALTEIETVTNNLARLIQSISAATEAQTQAASKVTDNMVQIQEITTMTTEGTKQTTASVGQLTALAEDLRKSVAGFKLS